MRVPRIPAGWAFCLIVGASHGSASAEIIEEIVAWVNGDIITLSDYQEEQRTLQAEIFREYSGKELDEAVERMREVLLQQMIDRKILVHHAQALGYDTDKMGETFLASFREHQKIESDAELARLLGQEGMSIEQVKAKLIEMYAPEEVIRFEVTNRIAVGDRDVEAYYDEHPEEFAVEGEVTFREIIVLAETDAQKRDRRGRAEEARARAVAGEDFAELAKQYSESGTAETGGLLGPLPKSDLSRLLARAAFSLQIGEISEAMETPYGFHIIRVESRREDGQRSLDEVREQVRKFLEQRRYRDDLQKFLEKARGESEWCVKPKYAELISADAPQSCEVP
jgi:peptidyl-prolyl cis-trans isomerase SurA